MTNEEALLIFEIMNNVVKVSTPEDLKPFSYAFIKNRIKIKPIIDAKNEYIKSVVEMNKIDNDEKLSEFLNTDEDFKKFLLEENDIELYKIKLDSLEGKEFDIIIDSLVGSIIDEN